MIVMVKLYFFLRLWIMWILYIKVAKKKVPEALGFRLNATRIYLYFWVSMFHINYSFLSTFPYPLGLASISKWYNITIHLFLSFSRLLWILSYHIWKFYGLVFRFIWNVLLFYFKINILPMRYLVGFDYYSKSAIW